MASPTNVLRNNDASQPKVAPVDMKLEVIVIPVSDVERAEKFYRRLGWRQDVTPPGSGVFQFTPPGSSCSIQFGKTLTSAAPGSAQRTYLIVSDIEATRNALVDAVCFDAETKQILGAAIFGTGGDEVVHVLLDVMYAKAPYTVVQRAMHFIRRLRNFSPPFCPNWNPLRRRPTLPGVGGAFHLGADRIQQI